MPEASNQEYVPYGPEWEKEMSKHTKTELIRMFKESQLFLKETTDHMVKTARNLGHPHYGLSSGATIAIDQIREEALDFLGVPKEGGEGK